MNLQKVEVIKGDVTHLIERLEAFEDRMAVRLDALFAKQEAGDLTVNFELHSRDGSRLKEDTKMVVTVYDAAGRLLAQLSNQSYVEAFFGFETYSFSIRVPGQIAKIRVIDESGDDYLYPASYFLAIELPLPVRKAVRAAV